MIKITRRHFIQNLLTGAVLFKTTPLYIGKSVAAIATHVSDFGGLIQKRIIGYTTSLTQAQELIKQDAIIHPRGAGHSCMGQSLREGSHSFTPEQQDIALDENGYVTASAATTLLDIDLFLEEKGLMLPTSPDHRSLSAGGVLSVGGMGVETSRYGAFIDQIIRYDLLLPDGEVKKNVTTKDIDFYKPLAGLGNHGTFLNVTMKTVPKPQSVMLRRTALSSVEDYVVAASSFIDEAQTEDGCDVWYAGWHQGRHWYTDGKMIFNDANKTGWEEGYQEYSDLRAFRKEKTDAWVFGRSYKYYIWSDHFVTLKNLKEQLNAALRLQKDFEEKNIEVTIYSCIIKAQNQIEHFPHYSDQSHVISIGLYANLLANQKEEAAYTAQRQLEYSKESQELRHARPYKYGWYWDPELPINLDKIIQP